MTQYSKQKGQYFTTNLYLKECVFTLINNNPRTILEPSMGQGDLVDYVSHKNNNYNFDLFEIDKTIIPLNSINEKNIHYCDFLTCDIKNTYDTIIGNPPYVKTKKGNLYIDFINKCYHLLNNNGELIFIVPSDFIKLTSSGKIINKMMKNGTFTHIIHPNNESLFKNASVDIIIFRYCKNGSLPKKTLLNNEEKFIINSNGILTFSNEENKHFETFKDYFDIYVGMVTGKESVYKNDEFGNISVLNGKEKNNKYILINTFPTDCQNLNSYMLQHKNTLINRKIKKFTEKNWYKWGAPRNQKNIEKNLGKKCIYISNLTRKKKIAFIGNVQYFGGSLLMMIPKNNINLENIIKYLNSDNFKNNYMYSGRFKLGHKQLSNSIYSNLTIIS
jgi:adenine-specific DNA-methyltransferase